MEVGYKEIFPYSEFLLKLSHIFPCLGKGCILFLFHPGRAITDLKFSTYRQKSRVILPLVSLPWLSVSRTTDLLFVYQAMLCVVCEALTTLLGLGHSTDRVSPGGWQCFCFFHPRTVEKLKTTDVFFGSISRPESFSIEYLPISYLHLPKC